MEVAMTGAMKKIVGLARERMISIPDLPLRFARVMDNKSFRYVKAIQSLEQLSPLAIMKRGYSIAMDGEKKIIRSVEETAAGDMIDILMHDGSLSCSVKTIRRGRNFGKEEKRP
jgi:exodeoxyribonuclease VII large subunit